MNSIGTIFASNAIVVALANLGGLIGLLIVVWSILSRLLRIAKDAWHRNIRVALRRARMRRRRVARVAASDIVIFVSILTQRAAICFLLVMSLVLVSAMPDQAPPPSATIWGPRVSDDAVSVIRVGMAGLVSIFAGFSALALSVFSLEVRNERYRLRRKMFIRNSITQR